MGGRLILRIVLAVLGLGVMVVISRSILMPDQPAEREAPKVIAAQAAMDLPPGLLIRPQDLTWVEVPNTTPRDTYIAQGQRDAEQLVGAVVRHPVGEGALLPPTAVVLPSSPGFLSAALKPDMRAISVAIDEVSGNAGLILPGDYVDLLLTQTVGTADDGESRIVSETVLSNVRVIAVGRTLRVDGTEKEDAKGGPAKARTTTLEVRPSEAEVVAVAARLGSLSLALRSLATLQRPDEQTDPATGGGRRDSVPVWAEDVSMARRLTSVREKPVTPPAAPPPMVRVIRGSSGSEDIAGRQQMPPIFGDDGGLE